MAPLRCAGAAALAAARAAAVVTKADADRCGRSEASGGWLVENKQLVDNGGE